MSGDSDQVKGRAKQAVGDLTDDRDMRREGQLDESGGKLKNFIDSLKGRFTKNR